jgi:predicted  nucleic acid-binding Zn-ribbon protein
VTSSKSAVVNATKTYTNMIERIEKSITADKAKLEKMKTEAAAAKAKDNKEADTEGQTKGKTEGTTKGKTKGTTKGGKEWNASKGRTFAGENNTDDKDDKDPVAAMVEKIQKSTTDLEEAKVRQKKDLVQLRVQCKEADASLKDAMKLLDDVKKESKLAKDRLVREDLFLCV